MRLVTLLLFSTLVSITSFSQQETTEILFNSENIEMHSTAPVTQLKLENTDVEDNEPEVSAAHIPTENLEEELSDSDQGMPGIIRIVGATCATFVGCIVGVGVTIWLCIKGKKAIESGAN